MNATDLLHMYLSERDEHDIFSDSPFLSFRSWRKQRDEESDSTFVNAAAASDFPDMIVDVDSDALYGVTSDS